MARVRGLPPAPEDGPIAYLHTEDHPIRRWFVGPPRWAFHAVCALLTLWIFWSASRPATELIDDDYALPRLLLFLCALMWLGRLIATLIRRERPGAWWAVAPIGGLVATALLLWQAPLHARFALAQDELASVARSVLAAPDPSTAAGQQGDLGRVGTYRVHKVEAADGAVLFVFSHGNGLGPSGMAYIPVTPVPENLAYVHALQHLRGPWYAWSDRSD